MAGVRIGLGLRLDDQAEARRRAACALRGLRLDDGHPLRGFVANMLACLAGDRPLSPDQERAIYRVLLANRAQITDRLLLEYAAERAR